MKFSYSWLKELNPQIPDKAKLSEGLTLYSFETENKADDLLEISIPPNRFSDAASHLGIAREAAAVLGLRLKNQKSKISPPQIFRENLGGQENQKFGNNKNSDNIQIKIEDNNLCPRYCAKIIKGIKVGSSPKWLVQRLTTCGLRPINNVVDAMNYVMLETGQPIHAFDLDKVSGIQNQKSKIKNQNDKSKIKNIIVRRAKKGEKITTLDDENYELDKDILVIADSKDPLAIAGIKGGKKAEITAKTKNIVIEAANFDPVNIYQTSKKLKLVTDASLRFAHGLSMDLPIFGINQAVDLVLKLAGGIADKKTINIYNPKIAAREKDLFDINLKKLANFLGVEIPKVKIKRTLDALGFEIKDLGLFLRVKSPIFRLDITNLEDVYEEIIRFYGYNKLPSVPPKAFLLVAHKDEIVDFSDKIKNLLKSLGFSEVYNYSFIGDKELQITPVEYLQGVNSTGQANDTNKSSGCIEVENPIAEDKKYLRQTLAPLLIRNTEDNLRFFEEVKLFEIGKVFFKEDKSPKEILNLALIFSKKTKPSPVADQGLFLELKGATETLLQQLGLTDYSFIDLDKNISWLDKNLAVHLESDHTVLGYLGIIAHSENPTAILEIDLEKLLGLIKEEREYQPLPKFPSMMRDISILADKDVRFSEILNIIYGAGVKFIEDVDLIDIYESEDLSEEQKSLTFRIVFQAEDHTLTDQEVGKEMEKIISALTNNLGATIR